jgi:CBS domain-containing protein
LVCAEDDKIVGIVTERDLLHRIPDGVDLKTAPITIVMTPNPETLEPSDTVAHALNFAGARGYRRVLVVSKEGVTVLTVGDLLDFIRTSAP